MGRVDILTRIEMLSSAYTGSPVIIAILQTCLQVKNADRLYEHIVYHIEEYNTARLTCKHVCRIAMIMAKSFGAHFSGSSWR
jgi:hypothetical protein